MLITVIMVIAASILTKKIRPWTLRHSLSLLVPLARGLTNR